MDNDKFREIAADFGGTVSTNRNSSVLTVKLEDVHQACKMIAAELPNFYHLTTITGVDEGATISLYYHFWSLKEFLSLKTSVPKENLSIPSISDIFPSSLLYEAELKDMLGITFEGNSLKGHKLLLPDNYPPEAPPPLRKEADPEKIRKLMQLE